MRKALLLLFFSLPFSASSQSLENFLADTSMLHASYSLYVADAATGEAVLDASSTRSLTPASVMKLVTSAAALELLGPNHSFITTLGYTGKLRKSGKLNGDIIIKGGGDPAFASPNFPVNYNDFPSAWIDELKKTGIRKITGKVITDDSFYNYLPVPSRWTWEDIGNYYGAGVYGASIFDNTYDIHFTTASAGTKPLVTNLVPGECDYDLTNFLVAEGSSDKGYVFTAPYGNSGWIAGSIPVNQEDFVLSASIPDPPLIFAEILDKEIRTAGIKVDGTPSTVRIEKRSPVYDYTPVGEYVSPMLSEIIEVLNHKSVNLYAEHLVKELGKKFTGKGSAENGLGVINSWLDSIMINGMFIVDGSGLSPANSINAYGLASLLLYMKKKGKYFDQYLSSLPDAGEGTLKNSFRDEVFANCLKAKSGSMTRVRSYAGYFTTRSGNQMVFAFITNDFSGPSANIVRHYEQILKEIILQK